MTDTAYKIKVMQAWEDGRDIRYVCCLGNLTILVKKKNGGTPSWNWEERDYEIAPDPIYINIYSSGTRTIYSSETEAGKAATTGAIRIAVKYEEVIK